MASVQASENVSSLGGSNVGGPASNTHALPNVASEKHALLVNWVVQNGGFWHPAVEIQYGAEKGFHAVVAPEERIASQTRIASSPVTVTMSVLNALNVEPFSNRGCEFPRAFLQQYQQTPEILQTFFLMEQYVLGEKSWWARYIATLPLVGDVKDLQFESEEDAIWIRGTNVDAALALQNQKWYNQFMPAMELLRSEQWQHAIDGKYTWEIYRWAASIFGSRSFSSQVLIDTLPAEMARRMEGANPEQDAVSKLFDDRFAVLLPVLDILNHKPAAKVEWQARASFVGLQVLADYEGGRELYNNYGPRDNEGLLIAYGFVLEDNPYDHITIAVQVPPGSPLEAARTWPADERSNDDFRCFLFNIQHPIVGSSSYFERALFSYDLLDSLSVLCANDRELQNMYQNQQTLMSSALPSGFDDYRNLLATICQIMQDCKARLRLVQFTNPTLMNPPLQPRTSKQRHAQLYRNQLSEILQTAISICALILIHASTEQEKSDVLHTMKTKLPQHCSPHLEGAIGRFRFLTPKQELFTFERFLNILPSPTSSYVLSCVHDLGNNLVSTNEEQVHFDRIKTAFAVTIATLCMEHRSGLELPIRIRRWMDEMTTFYPPEDESWSYVPPPGPWAPEDEPSPALMAFLDAAAAMRQNAGSNSKSREWLDPKKLCWGWSVMEEEGVRVPVEIEAFHSDTPETVTGPMGFLIYCKHY